jgi:hypothetical protein
MAKNKYTIGKGLLIFLYVRLFAGLIIMFYPFQIPEWTKSIVIIIGGLVLLTFGIEVSFKHMFKPTTKP